MIFNFWQNLSKFVTQKLFFGTVNFTAISKYQTFRLHCDVGYVVLVVLRADDASIRSWLNWRILGSPLPWRPQLDSHHPLALYKLEAADPSASKQPPFEAAAAAAKLIRKVRTFAGVHDSLFKRLSATNEAIERRSKLLQNGNLIQKVISQYLLSHLLLIYLYNDKIVHVYAWLMLKKHDLCIPMSIECI